MHKGISKCYSSSFGDERMNIAEIAKLQEHNITNKVGPITGFCNTHDLTGLGDEISPLHVLHFERLRRKSSI